MHLHEDRYVSSDQPMSEYPPLSADPRRARAALWSQTLNRYVEWAVGILMILLILDVWLGVLARYVFRAQIPWTEELARYLMIWAALLAVSCGIARREHIGFVMLLTRMPLSLQKGLLVAFDLLALGFFLLMFIYGIDMTYTGSRQFAMIFGISMAMPYASVPVASLMAAIQLLLVGYRDRGTLDAMAASAETEDAV